VIRHVVLLRWKPSATAASIEGFERGVRQLPKKVSLVRGFDCGANVGSSAEGLAAEPQFADNYDFAVVADFDTYADYVAYADSDAHHELVSDVVREILDARVAVQFKF
jgi:Stress responsive A/B Barrel Domain